MRSTVVFLSLILGCAGCASPGLNPEQQRAVAAFNDCQAVAPTANVIEIYGDGRFVYTARPGDKERMLECLTEKHGYKMP